ncbi:MAG: Ni/Fe hydrogenase subunit beta [Deltaproteobacteria bacterium]|nr:Ni/Fe hydrogenase subunit beta [Deltaproteobacteria bacterium]
MTAYTVYLEQLPGLLDAWSRDYAVHVPVQTEPGFYDFAPWGKEVEIAWDYDVAYNSPKRFLLPSQEDLIAYDARSCTAEPVFEAPKQLLFGVHPYDVRAIAQLDQLLESGAPDQSYRRRREQTLIFALDPIRVAETAFWSTMGAGQADLGFDLYWTKIGPAAFLVVVGSAKGEELLKASGPIPQASVAERDAARRTAEAVRLVADRRGLRFPWQDIPALLEKSWNSRLWRERSEMCLACGSCNVVCPTCYCFDIREEMDLNMKTGRRFRTWDACMLPSFALIAGGHNFRAKALERYRHRYYRKGKYIYDLVGELGCVGCGRCVRACTAGIANPMEVYNALWEEFK